MPYRHRRPETVPGVIAIRSHCPTDAIAPPGARE